MSIQSLPDEILLLIISKCVPDLGPTQTVLYPLLTVSRLFHRLVRRRLYGHVDLLLHCKSFQSFNGSITTDPLLASLVHNLRLHNLPVYGTGSHLDLGDDRCCTLELLQKLPKLQSLFLGKGVELPKPTVYFAQPDFLPTLRHLTISTWTTAEDVRKFMRLPSLKYLTVTRGHSREDGQSFALPTEELRMSVLRCLRFCEVCPSTSDLYQLLKMPQSLETLSITFDEQFPSANFTLGRFMKALFAIRGTLANLQLTCKTKCKIDENDGSLVDLSTFSPLRTLRIANRFILGRDAGDTLIARRDLVKRLPPGLSELWVCTRSSSSSTSSDNCIDGISAR